jgi:hypothetical protein
VADTLQPLISELFLGSWTNVTSAVERDNGQGIRISRKPLNWAERVGTTSASWTFKNQTGDFYGRNPNSQYFGLLGRNTQVRHRLRPIHAAFASTVSSSWPATDTGQAFTNTGGAASDYSSAAGFALHTHTSVNVARKSTLQLNSINQDITVDVKFAIGSPTGASVGHWVALRKTDDSNYYVVQLLVKTGPSVTLRIGKVVAGVLTYLDSGALTVGSGHAAGEVWTIRASIQGKRVRGMAWLFGSDIPAAWQTSVAADDTTLNAATGTTAALISRLETGNTNTLNVVAYWDNLEVNNYRFWGEIPSFTPQRDNTGQLRNVPVNAAGISQRLGAGSQILRSALTRAMDGVAEGDFQPVAHWPMEDGTGTTALGNLRDGGPAQVSGAVTLASYTGATGSDPVPVLASGAQISGTFPPVTFDVGPSGLIWQFQFLGVIPSTVTTDAVFIVIKVSDTGGDHVVKLQVEWVDAFNILSCRPYDRTGAQLTGSAIILDATLFDRPLIFSINLSQDSLGGIVSLSFGLATPEGTSSTTVSTELGASLTTTMPVPQSWTGKANSSNAGWSLSHTALYTDPFVLNFPNSLDNAEAINGFTGEKAGIRLGRLQRELDIPLEVLGDPEDTNECGPQRSGTIIQVLQDAADADQGVLQDARDIFGLQYIPRVELYNTDSVVTFDYSNADMKNFQVVDDDRTVRNKIIARRTGGSFATAEITTGPTSTSDVPDGIGVYPEDLPWNLWEDNQLFAFAGWRAHIKGWDEARYPSTALWRERTAISSVPALDSAVLAMDIPTHYTITNPPDDLPPDDIGLLVQGYDELLANFEHQITFDSTPSGPYVIMEIDDPDARVVSDHFLRTAVNTSATSWEIANSEAGMQLISDDAQDGWVWAMDGERVTVTDVAPPTIAFVGVGTASTGSSGSRTPGVPASLATGNLVLIFASTRNSGTGVPDKPTNWQQFYLDGNVAVFARIYDGVWTMPTVTFTGGAANEDTIAQSVAFSGKFNDVTMLLVASAGRLNASAQDIINPGIPIGFLPENLMAVYVGWKQDDWTGVAQPTSWTELQEAVSTAGNDAGQVWGYRQFTAKPTAGQLTPALVVTGGVSAISRGAVIAFASDYQLTTVTRSGNGIVKSHSAGAVPTLVPAPHLGL